MSNLTQAKIVTKIDDLQLRTGLTLKAFYIVGFQPNSFGEVTNVSIAINPKHIDSIKKIITIDGEFKVAEYPYACNEIDVDGDEYFNYFLELVA
jgi:hypothetical protein